jgi:hypothetical protein
MKWVEYSRCNLAKLGESTSIRVEEKRRRRIYYRSGPIEE